MNTIANLSNNTQPVICTDESALYRHKCLLTVMEQSLLTATMVNPDQLSDGLAYMVRALIDDLEVNMPPPSGGVDGKNEE